MLKPQNWPGKNRLNIKRRHVDRSGTNRPIFFNRKMASVNVSNLIQAQNVVAERNASDFPSRLGLIGDFPPWRLRFFKVELTESRCRLTVKYRDKLVFRPVNSGRLKHWPLRVLKVNQIPPKTHCPQLNVG